MKEWLKMASLSWYFYFPFGKGHIQFYSMSRAVMQQKTSEINRNGKIGLFTFTRELFFSLRLWWWDNNEMITKVTKKLLLDCHYLWWCIEESVFCLIHTANFMSLNNFLLGVFSNCVCVCETFSTASVAGLGKLLMCHIVWLRSTPT